ncbi:MAG: DUF6476 family protein [Paracoccaceae bacterium]
MDDPLPEPQNLRFLRRLVTVLTATMIIGIVCIVVLMFIRIYGQTPEQTAPLLPEQITLPQGAQAEAVTVGFGWYAVVTQQDQILIYDRVTGALRQTVDIDME